MKALSIRLVAIAALVAAQVVVGTAGAGSAGRARPAAPAPALPAAVPVELVSVQGRVYLLTGFPANVTVLLGEQGVLFVDTPPAARVEEAMAVIARSASRDTVRYVINTHLDTEHVGGDDALMNIGTSAAALAEARRIGLAAGGANGGVIVLGHENMLNRLMSAPPPERLPGVTLTSEYFMPTKDFFFNGDPIIVYHAPNAHTDGDSFVYFRRSDVISTGDLFSPGRFPEIDLARGGSINGLIDAVNRILEITVPAAYQEGGTYVIPGHGRICDEADVAEYREMITIVRDRVRHLIKQGKTLAEVQAARPTLDYDTTYGGQRGGPTAQTFVEAVYRSLEQNP